MEGDFKCSTTREKTSALQFLAGGLAERFEGGMLNEVCTSYAECLELGAPYPALDPLMHGLTGHRRVYVLSRLFNTMVIADGAVSGPLFLG